MSRILSGELRARLPSRESCVAILVYLQSVLISYEPFSRFISLLFVLCLASSLSFPLFMLGGSKLRTSANLPGFRDPLLDILEKFLRSLQGLVKQVSNMLELKVGSTYSKVTAFLVTLVVNEVGNGASPAARDGE